MKIYLSLSLLCFVNHSMVLPTSVSATQPKIAIIGGGAAGLAAARVFSRQGLQPVVFEKDHVVGGIWRRVPASMARPMYKGLRTNLPKEIMAYREFPFSSTIEPSFVTHEQVHAYLQDYAKHFGLDQYIRSNCCVKQVKVLSGTKTQGLVHDNNWNKIQIDWTTTTEQQNTMTSCSDIFDALCIANGHYARPVIPQIDGMQQYFSGRSLHSIEYDEPQEFAGQSVLCVGGRASGSDLAREIAPFAKQVYLSDPNAPTEPITQYNVTWVPKTTSVLPDGRVCFEGCNRTEHFDTIIFCTGYEYEFPFITEESNLELTLGGRRVAPLYEQLWHAVEPNVAFMGLPHSVLPFPLFELQAEALAHQWLRQWTLPSGKDLLSHAQVAAQSGGEGKTNGRVPEDTHYLGDAQWDYCRRMAEYAGIYDNAMRDYLMTNKTIYDDASMARTGDFPAGPDLYRLLCYARENALRSFRRWSIAREMLHHSAVIWYHSSGERKGGFPAGPDDYRQTRYERDWNDHSYRVAHSLLSCAPLSVLVGE